MKVQSQPLELEVGLSYFKKSGKPFADVAPVGGLNLESSLLFHFGLGCVFLLSGPPVPVVVLISNDFSMILIFPMFSMIY